MGRDMCDLLWLQWHFASVFTRTSILFDLIRHRGHLAPSSLSPNKRHFPPIYHSTQARALSSLRQYEPPILPPTPPSRLHLYPALRLSHPIAWYARADTKPLPILDSLPPWCARAGCYLLDAAHARLLSVSNHRTSASPHGPRLHRHAPTPPCSMPPSLPAPCQRVAVSRCRRAGRG